MSIEKPDNKTTESVESHSYNNLPDLVEMMGQEASVVQDALRKVEQGAAQIEVRNESGKDYLLVTNNTDHSIILKTSNPKVIELFFQKVD